MTSTSAQGPVRIALVGDRTPLVQAHARIPGLVESLARTTQTRIEVYWIHSSTIEDVTDLAGFDGIWVVPGSPYENPEGVITAVEAARTTGIPFLGTCGGFQHMLMEFARNVCGLTEVLHGEEHPDAAELFITPLECSLLGEEATVVFQSGTRIAALSGQGPSTERFFCRFGLNHRYVSVLEAHGLVLSGIDEAGDARVAELPGHPFFVGALFQPELSSDRTWVHPLICGFVEAARSVCGAGVKFVAG